MTFSHNVLAAETRMYWSLMNDGWARFLADPFDPEIDDILDELDVLALYTSSPRLAALCRRARELDEKLRQPLVRRVAS